MLHFLPLLSFFQLQEDLFGILFGVVGALVGLVVGPAAAS